MAAVIGAVLPDLPMLGFYAWETLRGIPEAVIWRHDYFMPRWQTLFDLPDSLLLILAAWLLARWGDLPLLQVLFLSMGLHSVTDPFTHGGDAHRHLWPLPWRFESPVSYWNPARFGWLVSSLELVLVVAGTACLFRRWKEAPVGRTLLAANAVTYVVFVAYAVVVWG